LLEVDTSSFRRLDVYALLDADTDEAKAFTTYMHYWIALASLIETSYGSFPFPAMLSELEARKAYRALPGKATGCDLATLRSLMLNAWNSELALHLIDLTDTERLWVANQWGQVQSYYATSRAASAWLAARDGAAPDRHRGLLNALSAQITGSSLYPSPWNLSCSSLHPVPAYGNFLTPPAPVHNLSSAANDHDRTALMLKTTRQNELDKRVEQAKRELKRRKAPKGEKRRQDAQAAPTTVFDFTWRMRTRSNYGDPALFYAGTLSPERSRDYAVAVRTFTSATMFLFEALVMQKARKTLEEAAVHFVSRDRSRLADQIIVPRLKALGLFAQEAA
jgi:hypothetical protein